MEKAGSVKVAIQKTGVEEGEKTVDVYKAAEQTLAGYSATANGGSRAASTTLALAFGEAVSLRAADILLTPGTGSARKGALSGSGKQWSLGITVDTPGDILVNITKFGIEEGQKSVAVYKPVSYDAAADSTGGADPSTRIDLVFSEAVADLAFRDLRFADGTGSAFAMSVAGSGQDWSVAIVTARTGDIRVFIERDGIDGGERIVTVYKPEEVPPPAPEITGITVITPPDTTLYAKNQPFDKTGLEVGWLYSDGTLEPLPEGSYTIEAPDMTVPTNKRVNIQAGNYKTSFWIQVLNTDKALLSISAEGPTNKTQELGKEFDRTGLVVTGHYSDGSTSSLTSLAGIYGYDKTKRGPQEAGVRVNGKTAPIPGITTRIGDAATVSLNAPSWMNLHNLQLDAYKGVFVKGEALSPETSNIRLTVKPEGGTGSVLLSSAYGNISQEEIAGIVGYNPNQPGTQTLTLTLDGRSFELNVMVIDTEPEVWFDYGYMRHHGDPTGAGKSAGINEGKYYVKPGETLLIAPVRYLVGYNADHSDAGASYHWTVSGGSWTTSKGGELLHFTPSEAGTYDISVSVTGRHYATGGSVTKTASTKAVCFDNNPPPVQILVSVSNYGPGQFAEPGGTGYGWSLGSAGGYTVWSVEHQASYRIEGNAFSGWHEPGIVWVQEDRNGNGLPDETWHEIKGGEDDDPGRKSQITRRYAVRYTHFNDGSSVNKYGQPIRKIYWSDSRGRSGYMPGGFPSDWGVTGNWVTYTLTLLRDNGNIDTGSYGYAPMPGYVDALGTVYSLKDAIDIAGSPVTLTAVRFVKVQTSVFHYGGAFGDVSTEITYGDFAGKKTNFPMPE
jgi:hypothetical protein